MSKLLMTPRSVLGKENVLAWMRREEINPDITYRIVIDTKTMTATISQFKANQQGKPFYDHDIDDVARIAPWDKQIHAIPPGGFMDVSTYADLVGDEAFA